MNNFYHTESLNLASWFLSKGIELKGYTTVDKTTVFYFEKNQKLFDLINKYNKNTELKDFISSFKQIKEIVRKLKK